MGKDEAGGEGARILVSKGAGTGEEVKRGEDAQEFLQ